VAMSLATIKEDKTGHNILIFLRIEKPVNALIEGFPGDHVAIYL
jgi:hypothetical protein